MYFQDILQGIASNLMDSNLFKKQYISQNIQVGAGHLGIFIFLSFFGMPPRLTSLFCTIYFIVFQFFCQLFHPQTFTMYQTLVISLFAMFFGKLFTGLLLTLF